MNLLRIFRGRTGVACLACAAASLLGGGCSKEETAKREATEPKPVSPAAVESAQPAETPPPPRLAAEPLPNAELSEADKAWAEVEKLLEPPGAPEEWAVTPPSEEQQAAFRKQVGEMAGTAADKAKDFYTRFPDHPRAAKAKEQEIEMLDISVQLGNTNRLETLKQAEAAQASLPNATDDDKLRLRVRQIQRQAMSRESEGMPSVMEEFEKGARELVKEFPERAEPWHMLYEIARNTEGDKSKALAQEIVAAEAAPSAVKEQAESFLKKLSVVGNPVQIQFTAIDGREVDLAKMKGKVVLLDFWAIWCQPCIAELPNVKAAYEKLHPQGFEIIGISLDQDKAELEEFVKKQNMPWPQYFDGLVWQNKIAQAHGIESIPAMWLIDKKGVVRDLNARQDLVEKVEKLLAEPSAAAE